MKFLKEWLSGKKIEWIVIYHLLAFKNFRYKTNKSVKISWAESVYFLWIYKDDAWAVQVPFRL